MDFTFPVPELESNMEILPHTNPVQNSPDEISSLIERLLQSYSKHSIIAIKNDLNTYVNAMRKNLQDSNEQDILKYIKYLEDRGYKNSSINRKIASLAKLCSLYSSSGLMEKNPIFNLTKISRIYKPVDAQAHCNITLHDIEAVIAGARKRTAMIVKFLANTGLRVSEMINISKSDLEAYNTEFMRILIRGKGGRIRFIFVTYELYQQVKDTFDSESIFLFTSRSGRQLSRVNIYKMVKKAFEKYAYKTTHPHQIRHFFASHKIVQEKKDYKSVSQYLGHASVSTTLQIYTNSELKPEESQII